MNRSTTGRTLLRTVAGLTAVSGFIADWNKTHLFNPNWTPHAKFHDAMTILLCSLLGASGLYLLQEKRGDEQKQLLWGTLLPSLFWTAMAGSFAFPGAKGLEAEFPDKVKEVGGVKLNEGFASALMLSLLLTGYILAKKK